MCVIIIRKGGYNLKTLCTGIIIYFKITSGQFPVLKNNMFHQTTDFIVIRVKIQAFIREIINGKFGTVIVFSWFAAYNGHMADTTGEYLLEGFRLIVLNDTELLRIPFHVFITCRKLQTGVSVFLRINILGAAYRKQACKEFHIIRIIPFDRKKAVIIAQINRFIMLTSGKVDGHPLHPPFDTFTGSI